MGNFFKKSGYVVPVSIAGIIWVTIVLCLADFEKAKLMFWGGFAFAVIAFIVSAVVVYLATNKAPSSLVEHVSVIYKATAVYLGISLLLNTIYVIVAKSESRVWTFLPNVIIILVFAGYLFFALRETFRIGELGEKIDTKTIETKMTAVDLYTVILKTEDEVVKKELQKLRETVMYSEQIGISATKQIEDQFNMAVIEIDTLIEANSPQEEILKKIKFASNIWAKRNSMISVLR